MPAGASRTGSVAGGLFSAAARYYFRQSPRRVLFLNLSATAGSNLDADQQILLGGDNGLRGYPLRYQSGEGRWLFTAEQRLFSNWYPFQLFNVGGAVFYDMGAHLGPGPARHAFAGTAQGRGLRPALRQQPLGARQRTARRRRVSARRRCLRAARPVPHRNEEELLMSIRQSTPASDDSRRNRGAGRGRLARRDAQRRMVERGGRRARVVGSRELAVRRRDVSLRWSRCTSCCWRRSRTAGPCVRCSP